MRHLLIAARGFSLVFLVSMNTVQVSHRQYVGATLIGFAISWLWWSNAHRARETIRFGAVAYGTGAALGTLCGMVLSYWWLTWV